MVSKPELLLVSPENGALLVKQEKAVLVEGALEGTLVVDEIVVGTEGIKNTNRPHRSATNSLLRFRLIQKKQKQAKN